MKKLRISIFLIAVGITILAGCSTSSQSTQSTNISQLETDTSPAVATDKEPITPVLDSEPGSLGVHVIANGQIEAGAEVLSGVTATMPEGMTRQTVSNLQHDFIKDGMQVGGILLVDIPYEMLEAAAKSYEGTEELAGYLANQVMTDADPNKITFSGGGKSRLYDCYIFLTYYDFSTNYAYTHYIYVGESYCYDVWFDDVWHPDGGDLINSTISSPDIKPELNDVDFGWSFIDGELVSQ